MEYNYNGGTYSVRNVFNREVHKSMIKACQEKIKDNLVFKDGGFTVYTKTYPDIELSKGCQACKNGRWWCIFVGNNCNLKCKFCPQSKNCDDTARWDNPRMISGYWIDDAKVYLEKFGDKLEGISYSGGEPLLYFDKVLELADYVNKNHKHIYQWLYTNGVLLTEEKVLRLKDVGIKEIRVDLIATNFSPQVLEKLSMIKRIIGRLTVEIPAIPETFIRLIKDKYIHRLVEEGVDQLNLGELDLQQPVNFDNYAANEDIYIYDYRESSIVSPIYSRKITVGIMEYVILNNLNILVNDCSNDAKHLQGIMREANCPKVFI